MLWCRSHEGLCSACLSLALPSSERRKVICASGQIGLAALICSVFTERLGWFVVHTVYCQAQTVQGISGLMIVFKKHETVWLGYLWA